MTAPQPDPYADSAHAPEPTPDQDNLVAAVAGVLLVGAAVALTAAALAALLRRRGRPIRAPFLAIALAITDRGTKHQPRMRGRSDVARAQQNIEAHYRAAYVLNAAERIQAAVDQAVAASSSTSASAGTPAAADGDRAVAAVEEEARRAAVRRERAYWAAHERARRARMTAALAVADAANLYGPVLGWYTHQDDRTTPECRAADGSNFRAELPPVVGWPGTLHGGSCRCEAGPPHPGGRSTDEATGFARRTA